MDSLHYRRRDAFISAHWCIPHWIETNDGRLVIKAKDRLDRPEVDRFLSDYADVFEFAPDREVFQLIKKTDQE